jgi:hypothetical protein
VKTTPLLDLAGKPAKHGVSVQRFKISREDAARVKEAERVGGQRASLRVLLEILFGIKVNGCCLAAGSCFSGSKRPRGESGEETCSHTLPQSFGT